MCWEYALEIDVCNRFQISMGKRKKDVIPLLTHWNYVFLALTRRYGLTKPVCIEPFEQQWVICFTSLHRDVMHRDDARWIVFYLYIHAYTQVNCVLFIYTCLNTGVYAWIHGACQVTFTEKYGWFKYKDAILPMWVAECWKLGNPATACLISTMWFSTLVGKMPSLYWNQPQVDFKICVMLCW